MGGGNGQDRRMLSQHYPLRNNQVSGPLIRHIYNDRLAQFLSPGEYRDVNLQSMLYHDRVDDTRYISVEVWSAPGLERPRFHEVPKNEFVCSSKGQTFGPSWSSHWFRITIHAIPASWEKFERVQLEFDLGEGLIYSAEGLPLQGLTGGSGDDRRVEYILGPEVRDLNGDTVLYIECSMNGMFGVGNGGTIQPPDENRYFRLESADLVAPNMEAWRLFWDFLIIKDLAQELSQDSHESYQALRVANAIMDTFNHDDPDCLARCRRLAEQILGRTAHSSEGLSSREQAQVSAVGHCHIDTAWLWPFAETKRKIARSWSTQCDLMDRYDEYIFTCSQAQQFKWLSVDYPELFARVVSKIKSKKFEPIGGTWVEMDTNLPSGESLCRQFLFGQRYFQALGARCSVFWLPDTFGYSSQLPQLARQSGMAAFFTQKLSWNNINTFPHTTFNWKGLDGTQILTHMAPDETYTAQADVGDVIRSVTQHKSLYDDRHSLLVYGNGDGGGGPLPVMVEKLRRLRGASDASSPSLPRVALDSVTGFFNKIIESSNQGKKLRSWSGELYFEFHRGTYTSQAQTKRNNRLCEQALHNLEYFATLASIRSPRYHYPRDKINTLWEDVLLCQFHDVLPGSCIGIVYKDAFEIHSQILRKAKSLTDTALHSLAVRPVPHTQDDELIAINPLTWPRQDIIKHKGQYLSVHVTNSGESSIHSSEGDARIKQLGSQKFILSNATLSVVVDHGNVLSFFDKVADRELVAYGQCANSFEIYDDQPLNWQAWDVEIYHLDKSPCILQATSTKIVSDSCNRVAILAQYKISSMSWITCEISLDSAHLQKNDPCSQLTFSCEVEWRENKRFLKVAFPTTLLANEATYDTQFGIVKRPTHFNTTWDEAKFEVCCHKFADLSEFNIGLSILNDCKYGFATHSNTMRLSLLRSPKAPDADADMGRHSFRYAMLSHAASFAQSGILRKAYEFNNPLVLAYKDKSTDLSHFRIEGHSNIILDTIKCAEEGFAIVLRLFESLGGQGKIHIHAPFSCKITRAWQSNILEDFLDELTVDNGAVAVSLKAFEVRTILLYYENIDKETFTSCHEL